MPRRSRPRIAADDVEYLESFYPHWRSLSTDDRDRAVTLAGRNLSEMHWETVPGLQLERVMQVAVAGGAALLILGFDLKAFPGLTSVIFHPESVTKRIKRHLGGGIISEEQTTLSGEAMHRGPVMISWPEAVREAAKPEWGRQVILHELAHKLDMIGGAADGLPPISSGEERMRFTATLSAHLDSVREGRTSVLRSYAGTSATEMFAVATELFFTNPKVMRDETPDLYEVLSSFYRQDPAS